MPPATFNDKILYNGIDPFSGIAGTPLVQMNEQFIKYGEQWGVKNTITLNGTITGSCNYFSDLISGQNSLIQTFSRDFQSLQIVESGAVIFDKPYCVIRGINFADSQYLKLLPFSIQIDCYESGFFSGTYGVLEPKNEFNLIEEKDRSIRIEHTVSCRGFNTSSNDSNALQNARNYINQYSGYGSQVSPYFIKLCSGITPSLINVSETIDRVVGTYGITETYIAEKEYASGVLRYVTTYDSGIQDGISTVSLNGTLKTAKNYPPSILRARYSGFDIFSAAVLAYSGCTNGQTNLNPYYLESGITEDQSARSLNFSIRYNNDVTPNPYLDYKIDFQQDELTSITTARFDGTIKGRGELSQRWLAVQNFLSGVDPFAITYNEYVQDGYIYFLNPNATTQSITKNPFIAEINLSASYNDKLLPPSGLAYLDYTFDFTPAITKYSAISILDGTGKFYISNLGYANRAQLRINGQTVIDPSISTQNGINILKPYINYLGLTYATGNRLCLEEQIITEGNKSIGKNISFSALWTYEDILFNP